MFKKLANFVGEAFMHGFLADKTRVISLMLFRSDFAGLSHEAQDWPSLVALFTQSNVVPNFSSVEHKRRSFEKCICVFVSIQ